MLHRVAPKSNPENCFRLHPEFVIGRWNGDLTLGSEGEDSCDDSIIGTSWTT